MPGTFAELRERLMGTVPSEFRRGTTAIMFVFTRDPKYTGPAWVRRLVMAGFAIAARVPVSRRIASSLVDDDLIVERGVRHEDLPCVAFFVANAGETPIVLRLPSASWSTPDAWKQLRTIFKEEFSGERVLELAHRLPPDSSPGSLHAAFEQHVQRIQQQIVRTLPLTPPSVTSVDTRPRPTSKRPHALPLPRGFELVTDLCREFDVPRSSAQRLLNRGKIPNGSTKKSKNRLYVKRGVFRNLIAEDGRIKRGRPKKT